MSASYKRKRTAEYKWRDNDVDVNPIGGMGSNYNSLMLIAQGTGESERIGRRIVAKSIHWRFNFELPSRDDVALSNQINGSIVRVILYVDKQANGAAASAALILQTPHFQSHKNMANQDRFVFLYDKTFHMERGNMTANILTVNQYSLSAVYLPVEVNLLCNIPIDYTGPGAIMADIASNNISVLAIARSTSEPILMDGTIRIRYTDL